MHSEMIKLEIFYIFVVNNSHVHSQINHEITLKNIVFM